MNAEEVKQMLWSKSPYKKGDIMFLHPEYIGGGRPVVITDIGYFDRNELFPFEFECKFNNGQTEWIKGHALVRLGEPPWLEEGRLLKEWRKNQSRTLREEALRRNLKTKELSDMELGHTKPVWPEGLMPFIS